MDPITKKHGVGEGANIDRISHLPDEILHHIISLAGLQIFDLVELGVLSKRWNRLWTTTPYLDIDINKFYFERIEGVLIGDALTEKFRSFISWVLHRQGTRELVHFKLSSSVLFEDVQITRWLRTVTERGIREIRVKFIPTKGFTLPLFIAVSESLRVLKLSLEHRVMHIPSVVRLNQLKCLELYDIEFTDSDSLQRLFSGCCSLESLWLTDCAAQNFTFLDFSSARLKELRFGFTKNCMAAFSNFEIKISCGNLFFFKYSAPVPMNCILEKASSLEVVWIHLFLPDGAQNRQIGQMIYRTLKEIPNVDFLHLGSNVVHSLTYVADELIRSPISCLKLRMLTISLRTLNNYSQVMFLLLNHCPNLGILSLDSEQFIGEIKWDPELWELQHGTDGKIVDWGCHPHLKTIIFTHFKGNDNELDFLRFLLETAENLETLEISLAFPADSSLETLDEVLSFYTASPDVVITVLDKCDYYPDDYRPDDYYPDEYESDGYDSDDYYLDD